MGEGLVSIFSQLPELKLGDNRVDLASVDMRFVLNAVIATSTETSSKLI
ncbi:hypothetical protein FORC065_4063 [Yersinia enterocolitica]|nr:hypothetical protein FORC065_4063 [Yersinia enterocolitica]